MEQEIRKHVHNIIGEISARKKSIWKKLGEIFLEMLIIIFAVSFAVFMERQREHNNEKKEAKEFLLGLKTDLQNDILEMQEDRDTYKNNTKWFLYFGKEEKLNMDTLRKHEWVLWNSVHLLVNDGRYEGFKSSGKMNTIESVALRDNILDLYQETLVGLTANTKSYIESKKNFEKLIYKYRKNTGKKNDNLAEVLERDEMRNYCLQLRFGNDIMRRYDSAITKSKKIIGLIEKEYAE